MNAAVSILAGTGGLYLAWSLLAVEVCIASRIEKRRRAGAGDDAGAGPS